MHHSLVSEVSPTLLYALIDKDWDIIKQVKMSVNIPVIGNGDVVDVTSDFKLFQNIYPIDATGADITSIDALSVGFTIADYDGLSAFICCLVIAVVTFFVCMGGIPLEDYLCKCTSSKD